MRRVGPLAYVLAVSVAACGHDGSGSGSGGSETTSTAATSDASNGDAGGGTSGSASESGSASSSATDGSTTGPTAELEIDCASPPMGAIGAEYSHVVTASGGAGGGLNWSAFGLPDGLDINPVTGEVVGVPSMEEAVTAEIAVRNPAGETARTSCDFSVGPQLMFDLSGLDPPCIDDVLDINDYITGGDGSPLRCEWVEGRGNGKLPDGITVNEDCELEGENMDDFGVIAWTVLVEQSGLYHHVPFCLAQPDPEPGAYQIRVDHSGVVGNTLKPAFGTFRPGEPPTFGNMVEPYFEILGGGCGTDEGECDWRWVPDWTRHPFDYDLRDWKPSGLIQDAGGVYIGYEHHFFVTGVSKHLTPPYDEPPDDDDQMAFDDRFGDRPWVLDLEVTYCIQLGGGQCNEGPEFEANKNGVIEFAIIMVPE